MIGQTSADYDSHDLTLYLGSGYNFSPTEKLRITPTASLQYQYFYRQDYTESGTGAIAFNDDDTNTLYSRLGVQISYRWDIGQVIVVPELMVGWEHEYLQENETINASFASGGTAFDINTAALESDSIFFGAGMTARLSDKTSVFTRYEGNTNSSGDIHSITGGIRISF